ncbi:toxin-antitoxin system YwqK family antitoxin [Polaribacter tangerinus]|uniref:toxin-antitoxin system YwqK family antitoxin n=1 Tax=Polaribacter tangerinus TaxID=1920034 RepID=UPI000B4B7E99|nr:hypothetical protein [Polaribacter tangerinus]
MKSIFLFLAFSLLFFSALVGQEKTWLDAQGNTVFEEDAVYFTFDKVKDSEKYAIVHYYKIGAIAEEFTMSFKNKEGKFIAYYVTGEVKTTGKYTNNLKDGVWKSYYRTGKIKEKGRYKNGEKVGVWKTFY